MDIKFVMLDKYPIIIVAFFVIVGKKVFRDFFWSY